MLSVQVDIAHPRGSKDVRPLMRMDDKLLHLPRPNLRAQCVHSKTVFSEFKHQYTYDV